MNHYSHVLAAFIWADATRNPYRIQDAAIKYGDGQDRLCSEMVGYAPLMAELFEYLTEEVNMEPSGVYAYEVAGPFGYWFREYILKNGYLPDEAECLKAIKETVGSCFESSFHTRLQIEGWISDFFKRRSESSRRNPSTKGAP